MQFAHFCKNNAMPHEIGAQIENRIIDTKWKFNVLRPANIAATELKN